MRILYQWDKRMEGGNMKKIEIVRLGVKEKDVYRAFLPDIEGVVAKNKITKKYLEENYRLKVKKILSVEYPEARYGYYVYYKGG